MVPRASTRSDFPDVQTTFWWSASKKPSTLAYLHRIFWLRENLTAISGYNQIEKIAGRLNLPMPLIKAVVDFLVQNELCIVDDGEIKIGSRRTHLGSGSPHAIRHHMNWRLRAMERMVEANRTKSIHYTFPMSLSQEVAEKVREELPAFVEKLSKWVGPSPSEVVRCLNMDWFEY
mgnify:CR=1 FL=1